MVLKSRGQTLDLNDQVQLTVQFKDGSGSPVDLDALPFISIQQPNGNVLLTSTNTGVTRIAAGKYSYLFTIPYNGASTYGVWIDTWTGTSSGFYIEQSFQFVVVGNQIPAINSDGYHHLGDDVPFNYSQQAIQNINKLIKSLKARLNSSGKSVSKDQYGNTIYVNCDIFSVDQLVTFLATALTDFNQTPYFTFYQFDDCQFVDQFFEILVEGATLYALSSKALIEKGTEVNIQDNGLSFQPATVADMLNSQYGTLLTHYWEKLKMIKNSLRPSPRGLGTFTMTAGGASTHIRKWRHLRARQLF